MAYELSHTHRHLPRRPLGRRTYKTRGRGARASADADEKLAAADTEDDNQTASSTRRCRDARRALDERVAALDAAVRVARTGKAGEDASRGAWSGRACPQFTACASDAASLSQDSGGRVDGADGGGALTTDRPRRSGALEPRRRPRRRLRARGRVGTWPTDRGMRRRRSSSAWTPSTTSASLDDGARAAAVAEANTAHEDAAAAAAAEAASLAATFAPRAEAPGTRSRGGPIRRGGGRV